MLTRSSSERNRLAFIALALIFLAVILEGLRAAARPYWSDELATVYVAASQTWGQMWHLSRTVDLNPPLLYTFVRLSFYVLGQHEFAGRLPSLLSFALAVGCIFWFLRRRVPLAYAIFGALLPLCNADVGYYATEARPYALLLGSLSAAVLAYDSIGKELRPNLARVALLVSSSLLSLSHVFGSIALTALLLAEAVRSWRTRRLDLLTWGCLLLPLLCCVTYVPLIAQVRGSHAGSAGAHNLIYRPHDRVSIARCVKVYRDFLFKPLEGLLKAFAVLLLLFPGAPAAKRWASAKLTQEEWTALLLLLSMPVLLAGVFFLRAPLGGYYPRYSIAVVFPACVFLALFASWRTQGSRVLGALLSTLALVFLGVHSGDAVAFARTLPHHALLEAPAGTQSTGGVSEIRPELPVVLADPITFFEAAARLQGQDLDRMVYLSDRDEAVRLEHSNAGESVAAMAPAFHLRSQVVSYRVFLAKHPRFLLLSRPQQGEWLVDALKERKAGMEPLGNFTYAGESLGLWLVSSPDER